MNLMSSQLNEFHYFRITPKYTFDSAEQDWLLEWGRYLARPNFGLCQCVNGGDVAAVKCASSGADSVAFILHS